MCNMNMKILLMTVGFAYVNGYWFARPVGINGTTARDCQLQERVSFGNSTLESCTIQCSESPKCVAMIFRVRLLKNDES